MTIVDLTHTLYHEMPVFPGEKSPGLTRDPLPESAGYVTHRLETNMHTGTHMDAPMHAKSGELTIDSYPAEFFIGKAVVLDVRGEAIIRMRKEWFSVFEKYPIILFCSGYDKKWGDDKYYYDYPVFEDEVALELKNRGVRIVGFDSPSPDKSPFRFHSIFLEGDRFMIENLAKLDQLLEVSEVEFMAFPLKIRAEASLIRAVARY